MFNGGVSLNPADFQPYRDQIQVLDLQKYGITADQIGSVKAFGQYHTAEKYGEAGSLYCELFCDGKRMTLARYPNEGEQLKTGKILDNGDSKEVYTKSGTRTNADWETMKNPRGGTFQVERTLTQRMKTWKKPSDAWLFGYFSMTGRIPPLRSPRLKRRASPPNMRACTDLKKACPTIFQRI